MSEERVGLSESGRRGWKVSVGGGERGRRGSTGRVSLVSRERDG